MFLELNLHLKVRLSLCEYPHVRVAKIMNCQEQNKKFAYSKNWRLGCTHRDAVGRFLGRSVEQEVSIRRTFDVDAVRCRFLRNCEHFIVVISQLFHHLDTDTRSICTTLAHGAADHSQATLQLLLLLWAQLLGNMMCAVGQREGKQTQIMRPILTWPGLEDDFLTLGEGNTHEYESWSPD